MESDIGYMLFLILTVYLLPAYIYVCRDVAGKPEFIFANVVSGWTGVGWLVCLWFGLFYWNKQALVKDDHYNTVLIVKTIVFVALSAGGVFYTTILAFLFDVAGEGR